MAKSSKKVKKQKGGGNMLLFAFVAVLLLLIMGGVAYFVFFFFAGEEATTKKPAAKESTPGGLITTIALFQHGARGPMEMNDSIAPKFPNGAGELTDNGIEGSFKLGQFLGQRYVQSGFLRSPPLPSQIHFRGRSINRCLMSGAVVGSGMFGDPNNEEFVAVPIYGQEKGDMILTHLRNCESEIKRLSDKCGKTPPSYENWPAYEGFVFECIGLNQQTSLFKTAADFAQVDTLIQQDENGVGTSEWFGAHKEEIYKVYKKMYSFIVGVNEYHDKIMLQLKQGVLMKKVHDILKNHWAEWKKSQTISKRKFIAYAAESWLVMAFLEALGCGAEALPGKIPGANAVVIIELRNKGSEGEVQVLYKDNGMDSMKDVTHSVRGCSTSPCSLQSFLGCCEDYMTDDPKFQCGKQS